MPGWIPAGRADLPGRRACAECEISWHYDGKNTDDKNCFACGAEGSPSHKLPNTTYVHNSPYSGAYRNNTSE